MSQPFVKENSIVRTIWGRSDIILLIFGGASLEFALNKSVDWLYYTGKLPSDPIGRLFSTVEYARQIVFSSKEEAERSIARINAIHGAVENSRGFSIPAEAYRDVLFMLIDYSIRSYELIVRKMDLAEKMETFDVFRRVGEAMKLKGLPEDFATYETMRNEHLLANLKRSGYSDDLRLQYKKHLGNNRYRILCEAQILLVPEHVRKLSGLRSYSLLSLSVPFYKLICLFKKEVYVKKILFPSTYRARILAMDVI